MARLDKVKDETFTKVFRPKRGLVPRRDFKQADRVVEKAKMLNQNYVTLKNSDGSMNDDAVKKALLLVNMSTESVRRSSTPVLFQNQVIKDSPLKYSTNEFGMT